MLPNVISAGFKRSGIYPFNPQAIDYGVITKKSSDTPGKEISKAKKGCPVRGTVNGENETLNLSHEQVQLFEKRYEEGYDLPDPLYLKWLKINHPKHDQTGDQERSILEDEELGFSAEQEQHDEQNCDLLDPHAEQYHESVSLSELACDGSLIENLGLERSTIESVTASHVEDTTTTTTDDLSCPGPSHLPSNAVVTSAPVETPDHEGELNHISKYLIQYVPVKKAPKTSKRATGARVLTSDECAKRIFEQEEKKRERRKRSTEGRARAKEEGKGMRLQIGTLTKAPERNFFVQSFLRCDVPVESYKSS